MSPNARHTRIENLTNVQFESIWLTHQEAELLVEVDLDPEAIVEEIVVTEAVDVEDVDLVAVRTRKSMEEIYLHSLPIKEYQIVDFFLPKLKDEVMKVSSSFPRTNPGGAGRYLDCRKLTILFPAD